MPPVVVMKWIEGLSTRQFLAIVGGLVAAVMLAMPLISNSVGQTRENNVTAPTTTDTKQTELKAFRIRADRLDQTAAQLRALFPEGDAVRIATEPRSGQLIIVATPEVNQQIGQFLETQNLLVDGEQNTEANEPNQEREEILNNDGPIAIQLNHVAWSRLENDLSRIWGNRLPTTSATGELRRIVKLPTADGRNVLLAVDTDQNSIEVDGPATLAHAWSRIIRALDRPPATNCDNTQVIPIKYAQSDRIRFALNSMKTNLGEQPEERRENLPDGSFTVLLQPPAADEGVDPFTDDAPADGGRATEGPDVPGEDDGDEATVVVPPAEAPAGPERDGGKLIGPVQIEFLEGLDVLVIRGHKRDVARITQIIEDIERLSVATDPEIRVHQLQNVDNDALAAVVTSLYNQLLAPRHGQVSITPLGKPNALLLIGREESMTAVIDLINRLDRPVAPETQFEVFALRYMSAEDAETMVSEFFEERGGLGVRATVTADYRSNSLIVAASPRDLEEIGKMISQVDVAESATSNELRVFKLRNTLAQEMAPVLEAAIRGDDGTGRTRTTTQGQTANRTTSSDAARSAMLTLMTIDPQGGRLLKSGILTEVRITADPQANAILVAGPIHAMELIGALIEQLDSLPVAEAQIKVFTIVNSDASNLLDTLDSLFERQQSSDAPVIQSGAGPNDSALVPLRFSVDLRTNSIIASGSRGDLAVVEAILLRLDASDVRQRKSMIYRLNNSPANDVALAINEFLRSERQVEQIAPEAVSPFEQIEREVIVVPEPVSNTLIVSATPRFFDEIKSLIEDLDKRPPMIVIQVLLAEVAIGDVHELGVELGIQDSLLFDRGVVTDVVTPGFLFNNQQLGNSSSADSLATRENLAGQAISAFSVGRSNDELGYGGLVLSAGSESISILVRALQDDRRLDIISRPQVVTLDNQSAFIQVGQRVPRITSTQLTQFGTVNNTVLEPVGILLGVTPRVSPDGVVVMEIDAEKSKLQPVEDGIPIFVGPEGDTVRSPIIDVITAQTTVSARSGQTIVLGGLIATEKSVFNRKVPVIGDVPILGHAFRYDTYSEARAELLIIMTPHIIYNEQDMELLKQVEADRMSWCLADIVAIQDDPGLQGMHCGWNQSWDEGAETIYPDRQPSAPEVIPPPEEPSIEPMLPPSSQGPSEGGSAATSMQPPITSGRFGEALPMPAHGTGVSSGPVGTPPPAPLPPRTGRRKPRRDRRMLNVIAPASFLQQVDEFRQFEPTHYPEPMRLPPTD